MTFEWLRGPHGPAGAGAAGSVKAHFHQSGARAAQQSERCVAHSTLCAAGVTTFVIRASRAHGIVMSRLWMLVLLAAGAAAAGGRLPRTSPPAPSPAPSPAPLPRLPQRNLTLSNRSSVRNRSVPHTILELLKLPYSVIKIFFIHNNARILCTG